MIQSILIESNFGPPLAEQILDMHSPILAEQKRAKLFARPETLGKTHKITDPGMLTITRMGIGKCIRGLTERPPFA
jgi:hypothetical protein